jgi:hypothetical protein
MMPVPATIVGGAAAACGYVLGNVAVGGLAVFAASLATGVALLVTFAAASVALQPNGRRGWSARSVAVLACTLVLTAVVTAGAGALRPAW